MRKYRKAKLTSPLQLEKKTIMNIIGFTVLAFSVLLFLSFFTQAGILLATRDYFYNLFGIGIIFLPPLAIIISLPFLHINSRFSKTNVIAGFFAAILSLIGLIAPLSQNFSGLFGKSLWLIISPLLTPVGAAFVLFFIFLISLVIAFNTSLDQAIAQIVKVYQKIKNILKFIKQKIIGKPQFITKSGQEVYALPRKSPPTPRNDKVFAPNQTIVNNPPPGQIWQYPPLSLLSNSHGTAANRGNVKQNAHTIEKTLESFGIAAKVVEVNLGPTVTQYALEIPMGTKLSKILALQNDLALALATLTGNVRIEAPIPGKSLVGIEIPNISPEFVPLKNILSSDVLLSNKSKTAVGLGLDVSGSIVVADIAKMPHVLIAGTTGSGKSVLLNALIATLLFRASPQEIKLILADPKRVELSEYNDIPHLLTPVIVEPDKILSALKWAMAEMDRRYKLFHEAQVRNIAAYNEFSGFQALPYIIIVVDELHNLMEFAPVEVEDAICRIAAMARATGIHLVIATQRPSVDVITGLIKANIPCRVAFNVSSMVDSRVIIDQPGADKLLGKGDLLYVPPDAAKPMRLQGVFVSDTEIRNLINFLKRSGLAPEYTEEVTQIPVGKMFGVAGSHDDLFEEAVRTICQYDRASASLLQRRLRIGYARAARLLDELESAGIVGPGEGSKPRDVLVKNAEEFLQTQTQAS
ncbi:DNA translocase FtsK [Candidatus Curtissbacteria bacterium]|nr:DNA translocase FtsK [Candidatus Curtissbacteria bacterium]